MRLFGDSYQRLRFYSYKSCDIFSSFIGLVRKWFIPASLLFFSNASVAQAVRAIIVGCST